jgi:hypothetical protein
MSGTGSEKDGCRKEVEKNEDNESGKQEKHGLQVLFVVPGARPC